MTDSSCENRGRPDSQCENSDRSDAPDNAAASSIRGGETLPPGSADRSSALLIVGLPSDVAPIPNSLEATRTIDSSGAHQSEEHRPIYKIGDYELLAQIAVGGMGVVYKARQVSLNRIVAFKTIRGGRLSTEAQIARFRNEAHATAVLHHSNIVPVYEFGEIEGVHYFSMEFVDGHSLAERIALGPIDPDVAAGYLKEIARTIAYAHSRGFLHRDLKPSNILVDSAGRPRVTDFGLVKPINAQSELTGEGAIVGTPSYMAPEQSLSNCNASPASDIYSLGAILYALLTGRPPFSAENDVDTLIQVRTKEPTPPRAINNAVASDLELICLKCLAKEPARRYATANLLADDLECYLAGAPVAARSVQPWERLWLWSRRHPVRAAATLLGAFLFCAWIVTVIAANVRLNYLNESLALANRLLVKVGNDKEAAALQARELQVAAEENRARADELLYVSDMQQAGTAWRSGDIRRLVGLLKRHQPRGQDTYQGGEWEFLWRQGRVAHRPIAQGRQPVYYVCVSPSGQYLAAAGKDATIRIYDLVSSDLTLSIETHQIEVNGLAFSPNGTTLASAGDDGTIGLWEIDWKQSKAQRLRSIKAHPYQAFNVLYTRDGRTLISAGRDTEIRLWDAASGRSVGVLAGHRDTTGSIVLHPSGKWIASAGHDGDVIVWDVDSRAIVRRIPAGGKPILSIDFSGDGGLLAASTIEHDIRIWRVSTWELANKIELLDQALRVLFMPGGGSILACDSCGIVRLCPTRVDGTSVGASAQSARPSRAWRAHRDQIYAIALSPNAREVITAGSDGEVNAWNLGEGSHFKDLREPQTEVEDIQFIPGSNRLAVSDGRKISLYDPETLLQTRVLGQAKVRLPCLAASRDGSTLVAGGMGGVVSVYDLRQNGREVRWNVGASFNVFRIAISADGRFVAAIDRYNSEKHDDLYVMDAKSGKRLDEIHTAACNSAAFSPDGQWLFASGPANDVIVWNVQTQKQVSELPGHVSSINSIQFAPGGQWVASASDDRLIKIWNPIDWRLKFTLEGARRPITDLTISPDGRTLASSEEGGALTLWHSATDEDLFQPLFAVDFSPAFPERISFSSDNRLLACVLNDPGSTSSKRFVRVMKWRGEVSHLSAAKLPLARRR
ncbi:MAG TPA: serine/threonine-protein kinase [Planctomycetaceae bacterium]|jgi:WD40 repeat protein/tRNA A-37 threonylcarbamoyl transferase component Bud32|nr:serine/threonine-protein kinase [Planctomycetaceae bacterium]